MISKRPCKVFLKIWGPATGLLAVLDSEGSTLKHNYGKTGDVREIGKLAIRGSRKLVADLLRGNWRNGFLHKAHVTLVNNFTGYAELMCKFTRFVDPSFNFEVFARPEVLCTHCGWARG